MKCPPLVQEVVYNGILKKDRRSIHEKIARKIENMFADRLNPYYETLTFEYLLGRIYLQTALHGGCLAVGRCQQSMANNRMPEIGGRLGGHLNNGIAVWADLPASRIKVNGRGSWRRGLVSAPSGPCWRSWHCRW